MNGSVVRRVKGLCRVGRCIGYSSEKEISRSSDFAMVNTGFARKRHVWFDSNGHCLDCCACLL